MAQVRTIQLMTEAGQRLAGIPWNVYPRPQMKREGWINLNGEWDFAVSEQFYDAANGETVPYDRKTLVPFPVESALSGIGEHFPEGTHLYYRTCFTLDALPEGKVLLLHCGGIDQHARILLNREFEGVLSIPRNGPRDIVLHHLHPGENVLELLVTENSLHHLLPYGKQRKKRGGMWYTPVSGVWQTVWLEWVPETYISEIKITPSLTNATVEVAEGTVGAGALDSPRTLELPTANRPTPPPQFANWGSSPASRGSLRAVEGAGPYVECEGIRYPIVDGKAVITPEKPKLWTPETPHLYEFTVKTETDEVKSYFALRTVETKTVDGVPRLCLNGKPYFFHALLDQGYWPDGIYTPASPKCYEDDILAMKQLGFNTLRKHIKVEPEQFYYGCDRLGMLVMQDMVNNGRYSFLGDTLLPTIGLQKLPDWLPLRKIATKDCFRAAMESTVKRLYNHPSIVYWTIFNEGWGQFSPSENYDRLKKLDSSRIIDTTSGWFRGGKTDVESRHVYFKRFRLPKSGKPVVLSEFGGYSCKIEGHSFNLDKTYGYRFFKEPAAFMDALEALYKNEIVPTVKDGLSGAVYTQVSDVEDETNGLLTYDRRVCKVDPTRMQALADRLRH